METQLYELGFLSSYQFVVIFARYRGQWLYARHKMRETWETAGGHVEPGETALDAARRELFEETGALVFSIWPLFDYAVSSASDRSNGQVYLADVRALGPLPESEMGEVRTFDLYPNEMTYPDILPKLLPRVTDAWERMQK